MKKHALQASATAVPNHRRQWEGTIACYGIEKNRKTIDHRYTEKREKPFEKQWISHVFLCFFVFSVSLCLCG
jgi:hypothetical protein